MFHQPERGVSGPNKTPRTKAPLGFLQMLNSKFKNEFKMLLIYLFNLVANSSADKQRTLDKRRCKNSHTIKSLKINSKPNWNVHHWSCRSFFARKEKKRKTTSSCQRE